MNLTDKEKQTLIAHIQNGEPLPKEYIYKLFAGEEDVFLFWNGRREETTNIALPFHSIEHIDEPRQENQMGTQSALFDLKGRQLKGWTNKLIWGDNKLILSSLANGPMREAIEKEGGLKLIYIDPPFAVGADFSFNIEINGETAEKKQSVIEEIAYRDTWGKGISSYLSMIYERLKLMHRFLADDGSIYIHCDWRVSAAVRFAMDDVFGKENFLNEVVWCYSERELSTEYWNRKHDVILFYAKNAENKARTFNWKEVTHEYSEGTIAKFNNVDEKGRKFQIRGKNVQGSPYRGKHGLSIDLETTNPEWVYRDYLDEKEGIRPRDWWADIPFLNRAANEREEYPTQKPEALLERIIKASSNEGDLVADFFCGSGTTAATAEKLGRKWICCDLGRFAVHTARKRLIGVQRELQKEGKDYRAFELVNLGKYERQFFLDSLGGRRKEETYVNFILEAYHAQPVKGHRTLHGRKAGRMVHVGPLDVPVTKNRVYQIFEECKEMLYTQVDVLGFEFEMGLAPYAQQELKAEGVDVRLRYIPKEVFDKRAVDKGQVRFFDVAYLRAVPKVEGRKVEIELADFLTSYTQDDIEEVEQKLRKGSKVVIENGQIVKITKGKSGIITRTVLTERWQDWIDYWAIDFNYEDRKEIIQLQTTNDEVEEQWTGNYIFENEWQSFRTKKNPVLEFTSSVHTYDKVGKYKVLVKVVDILGVDTSQVLEVEVK